MKILLIPCLAFLLSFAVVHLSKTPGTQSLSIEELKAKSVGCSPNFAVLQKWIDESDIPPMPGAGEYKWDIKTSSDSAQFYFNQGINMYYGFHIIEALASFKKAARFDKENAMIWWAQALAYGPNINDVSYSVLPQALQAVENAKALRKKTSGLGNALITAMAIRYSDDASIERSKLNADYTNQMRLVYLKFPQSADAAALYTDAMMLEHPWELWNVNGTPRSWTPLIQHVLEESLAKAPRHPGLNHYYIHVMEPSPFPEKAMKSADVLGELNPGLAHLVHMPSHIYLRTGYYTKGFSVNEKALAQYKNYLSLYPAVVGSEFLYRLHNQHMQINCATHAGLKKHSIDASLDLQKIIDTASLSTPGGMGNYMQYMYMIPVLTYIRFQDWDALIAAPAVKESHVYANLLSHFGRGMGFCGKDDIVSAEQELQIVKKLVQDSVLYASFAPFSSSIDGAVIAENLLEGTVNLKKGQSEKALNFFNAAVDRENKMVYNEPRDWLLNPKYYLANAFLVAGKLKEAEKTFQDDLKDNNENVWSLSGLYQAELKLNKKSDASQVLKRLKAAASGSDIDLIKN